MTPPPTLLFPSQVWLEVSLGCVSLGFGVFVRSAGRQHPETTTIKVTLCLKPVDIGHGQTHSVCRRLTSEHKRVCI